LKKKPKNYEKLLEKKKKKKINSKEDYERRKRIFEDAFLEIM
jgi:hypothetical protein